MVMTTYFFIKSVSTLFCLYLYLNPQIISVAIIVPQNIVSEKKSVARIDIFDKRLHFFNVSRYGGAQKMQKYFRFDDSYDWKNGQFCSKMSWYTKWSKVRTNLEAIKVRPKVKVSLNKIKMPLNKVNKDKQAVNPNRTVYRNSAEYTLDEKNKAMNESFSIVRSFLTTH